MGREFCCMCLADIAGPARSFRRTFYDALYSKSRIPGAWAGTLDDMKSANCNTVLMYTHDLITQPDTITKALDEAHARGIKVWLHLSWIFSDINPRYAKYDRYRTETDAVSISSLVASGLLPAAETACSKRG